MKVMTYNIRHGLGNAIVGRGDFGTVDLERTAEVIRSQDPDIVALQEVDRFWARSGGIDQLETLIRLIGMEGTFAANLVGPAQVERQDSSHYGVSILTKYPVIETRHVLFPGFNEWEPRGMLEVTLDVPGVGPVMVITSHLEVVRPGNLAESVAQRTQQATIIANRVAVARMLAIVMGDFNAQPDDPELSALLDSGSDLQDAWVAAGNDSAGFTIPANHIAAPDRRIDYILATHNVTFVSTRVVVDDTTRHASDHFPIVAELHF